MGQTTVGKTIQQFTVLTGMLFCAGVANAESLGTADVQRLPSIYGPAALYEPTADYFQTGVEVQSNEVTQLVTDDDSGFFEFPEFTIVRGQDPNELVETALLDFVDYNTEFNALNEYIGAPGKNKRAGGKNGSFCRRPGEITFKPGLRMQTRYNYNDASNNNDIYIRRFRLKGSGRMFDLGKYGFELKTDSTSQYLGAVNPATSVENAWMDFTLRQDLAYLRVGLGDVPFSRDALTSDGKLLLMDRSLAKSALTNLGMADNGIGIMLHGRPRGGTLEYAVGVFDNVVYENYAGAAPILQSNELMPVGRVVWNLLDPAGATDGYADYRASYLGEGRRISIGANAAYLGNAMNAATTFDLWAYGVDLFMNSGPFVFQAEYDWFTQSLAAGDVNGNVWFVQGGVMVRCWELNARYQSLVDPINPVDGSTEVHWTSFGVNYYIHEHNLKVQADYTWKDELGTEIANDGFQVQLQLDF